MTFTAYADDFEDDFGIAETPREFRENCSKCNGRGKFLSYSGRIVGDCFSCEGRGYFIRKTSPEVRARAKVQGAARKARLEAETLASFAAEHAEIAAWIESARADFPFAEDMRAAVIKFGALTDRQIAACQKCIDARAAARAAKADRIANAPTVSTDKLMGAFDAAKAAGLSNPKMRFDGFTASLAKATSANAGAVYLKNGDTYLGKIAAGKLIASRDCGADQAKAIAATMADPLTQAIAYGRRTGRCSCCGRTLTDPESIDRGIGPICAENFGL